MSNNLFYKSLASLSTIGILILAVLQVSTAFKKGNNAEDQLAKSIVDIKSARTDSLKELKDLKKDVLTEFRSLRSESLKELDNLRTNTLNQLRNDRANALLEVKSAKEDVLKMIKDTPSANNNAKTWLLLRFTDASLQKIPMSDMSQCEMQGAIYTGSKRLHPADYRGFECIESE